MALKKVVNLNEGPMDYLRGAAKQVAPAIRQVRQAGQMQSQIGSLDKAVKALAQLMSNVVPQEKPASPQPQYAQPGTQAQVQGSTQQMPTRPQMTFASFVHATDGDQLNEGVWDFVKGASSAVADKVTQKMNSYANRPSAIRDVLNAGVAASREGNSKRQSQQVQTQIQTIRQLVSGFPDQAWAAKRVAALLRKYLGSVPSQRVYAMVFPQQSQQSKQPVQQPTQTSASWQQQGQPMAQRPAQQPLAQQPPAQTRPRRRVRPVAP